MNSLPDAALVRSGAHAICDGSTQSARVASQLDFCERSAADGREERPGTTYASMTGMNDFTPVSALIGGALIGAAAAMLLLANGRIAGISGILGDLLQPARGDKLWRALFLLGLVLAGVAGVLIAPERIAAAPRALPQVIVAGLLVGVGTRLAGGCTSGHGVCGVSRLSPRSIVATIIFVLAGMITVTALGGAA